MRDDAGIICGFSYSGEASKPRLELNNLRLTLRGLEYAEAAKKGKFDIRNLL